MTSPSPRDRRFYAYGRHALVDALALAGVSPGERVMLPRFICRDVLPAITFHGAIPTFYDVSESLQPCLHETTAEARIILVVNYFGFPSDLSCLPSEAGSNRWIVIEDNAHGWLSRDTSGSPLGSRTLLSITSFRKTIRSVDGAFLEWDSARFHPSGNELTPRVDDLPLSYRSRYFTSQLSRRSGRDLMSPARQTIRALRLLTGKTPLGGAPDNEYVLPQPIAIHMQSLQMFEETDTNAEVLRRRSLYASCETLAHQYGVRGIFASLPNNTCPMGFPFFGQREDQRQFARAVRKQRLGEIISWPELPNQCAIHQDSPLRDVRLVNFLV